MEADDLARHGKRCRKLQSKPFHPIVEVLVYHFDRWSHETAITLSRYYSCMDYYSSPNSYFDSRRIDRVSLIRGYY